MPMSANRLVTDNTNMCQDLGIKRKPVDSSGKSAHVDSLTTIMEVANLHVQLDFPEGPTIMQTLALKSALVLTPVLTFFALPQSQQPQPRNALWPLDS